MTGAFQFALGLLSLAAALTLGACGLALIVMGWHLVTKPEWWVRQHYGLPTASEDRKRRSRALWYDRKGNLHVGR